MRWPAATAALLALATPAVAEPAVAPGHLVEGMACRSDPGQTYTLYLPAAWVADRAWPTLLVFDPRGRSASSAELFRPAAEELGWVVLSSNDTRSDGPMEPNVRAVQALWGEVQGRWSTDPRRLYLAGFSGGGTLAWEVARRAAVAGVIVAGAPWEKGRFEEAFAFASFGAAGTTDFNYAAMRSAHARFREWGIPERLALFEGGHAWMPPAVAGEALAWLELQAMKGGRRERDESFIGRQMDDGLARAGELESEGRPLEALRRLEALIATFEGLGAADAARREAERLRGLPATTGALETEARWDRYEEEMGHRHERALLDLMRGEPPFRVAVLRSDMRLEELQRRAAATGYEAVVARRILGTVATRGGFYTGRELLARGDVARAAAVLELATEAAPGRPGLWYNLACARARSGEKGRALDALEEAVVLGFRDRALLATDRDLDSLRGEERFQALLPAPPEAVGPSPEA